MNSCYAPIWDRAELANPGHLAGTRACHRKPEIGCRWFFERIEAGNWVLSAVWGVFATIRVADHDQTVGQPEARALVKTVREWRRS